MDDLYPRWLLLARVLAIASSGIFAGYTFALSDATLPAILIAPVAKIMVEQWKIQYIRGFMMAIPCTISNIVCWALLAYAAPSSSLVRQLYMTAAVSTGSGTVFAWTFLRRINGALSIRHTKLTGEPSAEIAMNYSTKEKWSKNLEAEQTTAGILRMWKNYNHVRALIMLVGTFVGSVALAIDLKA